MSCPEDVRANAFATDIEELPREIYDDLMRITSNVIGSRENAAQQRDEIQINEPHLRYYRGIRFNNVWYIQYEQKATRGVQTVGYIFHPDGFYYRSPLLRFGGPACETIRAALNGVVSPVQNPDH